MVTPNPSLKRISFGLLPPSAAHVERCATAVRRRKVPAVSSAQGRLHTIIHQGGGHIVRRLEGPGGALNQSARPDIQVTLRRNSLAPAARSNSAQTSASRAFRNLR